MMYFFLKTLGKWIILETKIETNIGFFLCAQLKSEKIL